MLRVTVPLFNCDVPAELADEHGRRQLSDRVWLGWLNPQEAERVRSHYAYRGDPDPPAVRVEIFHDGSNGDAQLGPDLFRQQIGLLALSSMALPVWQSIPIDVQGTPDAVWSRIHKTHSPGGVAPPRYVDMEYPTENAGEYLDVVWRARINQASARPTRWVLDEDVLARWSSLAAFWPDIHRFGPLDVALEYFTVAVHDLATRPPRAHVAATTAVEALLKGRNSTADHMARRTAHLLGQGMQAKQIYSAMKRWHRIRNNAVHDGTPPNPMTAARFTLFVRSLLPTVTRLLSDVSGVPQLHKVLDDAAFTRPALLDCRHEDAWWADAVPELVDAAHSDER